MFFRLIKNLFIGLLRGLALPVLRRKTQYLGHELIVPLSTYSPWTKDAFFQNLYQKIKSNTLVDIYRCYELYTLTDSLNNLEGDILEVGVWRGGTGCLMAKKSQELKSPLRVYLCDTFTGVVKAGKEDSYYSGNEHKNSSEMVVNELISYLKLNNILILKGIFPDETQSLIADNKFKLCHIDVDVYDSAKQVFLWVWPRMVNGGVVVFDDYGFPSCDGVTKLVEELKKEKDLIVIHNLNGHGLIIKR